MSKTVPQDPERREVPAAALQPGQHVHEFAVTGGIGQVEHAKPYIDSEGHDCIALLLTPLGGGVPSLLRPIATQRFRLATDAEIEVRRDGGRRRELAAALVDLAERIERDRLPVPRYTLHIGGCVDTFGELEQWAEHLGVEITPGGTDGSIPVAGKSVAVPGGPALEVRFQTGEFPAGYKSSTGDTSPSVAGAVGVTAPSGPEGRDSGPDTPTEHEMAAGWGGEPGTSGTAGVSCACGETYDGFDSIAGATALLNQHIADATAQAVPMADCQETATLRIAVSRRDSGARVGSIYTCEADRPAKLARLLAHGLRGRTVGSVAGEPCGHEVNYDNPGAPLLGAPVETAAGEAGSSKPAVRVAAAPAAPAPHAGAAGVTPDRPSYDPNPTIDGRNPDQAYAEYADHLDQWAPGWHHDDQRRMATGLAREASNRLAAEAEQNGSGQ